MARKATTKSTTGRGRGTRSGKARPEQGAGTALEEPMPRRGEAARHEDQTSTVTHDQIAERAQEIWRRRGFPHGEDKEHWYEAERQLKRERSGR